MNVVEVDSDFVNRGSLQGCRPPRHTFLQFSMRAREILVNQIVILFWQLFLLTLNNKSIDTSSLSGILVFQKFGIQVCLFATLDFWLGRC